MRLAGAMSHSGMRVTTVASKTDALISIIDAEPCVCHSFGRAMSQHPRKAPLFQACSLCGELATVEEVPAFLVMDHVDIRALALELIASLNPVWRQEEGCCERCWRFYVSLGRVLNCTLDPAGTCRGMVNQGIKTNV